MPPPLGKKFAQYELVERLGAGGMGEVFRARDARLGRDVAIKFLAERFASDPSRLTRFEQEARAASSLNHPNIVTVHEVGQVDGLPYIVMELVDGRTLRERLNGRPMAVRKLLDIAVQTSEGLAKAHGAGIVHRDLKPENVMLTGDGLVKILDFGLAKLLWSDSDGIADTRSFMLPIEPGAMLPTPGTSPGVVLGTAAYMSPEQARGGDVDYRSDQFAFGSMLYEMATGRRAFQRPSAVETLAAVINDQPDPVVSHNPDTPPPLRWMIERCLAKDPEDRYASTLDLARELRGVRDHLGEVAVSSGPLKSITTPRPRRLGPLLAVLVVLALAVAVTPVREWLVDRLQLRAVPVEKQIAVLPFSTFGDDPASQAFCEGLVETLTSKLTQLEQFQGALWVVPASEVRREGVVSAAAARRVFGVTLVVTGSVQRAGTRVRLTANLVDAVALRQLRAATIDTALDDVSTLQDGVVGRVADMLEVAIEPRAHNVLRAGETTVAGAYPLYLEARGYLQRYEKPENIERAITLFQRALEQDPQYALAYAGLGEAYWRQYSLTRRPEHAELAQKSCRRAVGLNDLLAAVHVTLGIIDTGTGRAEEAVDDLKRALELDPASADAHRELAAAYSALGRLEEAEATFRKAIELRPTYWATHNALGAFYYTHGRYAEAEKEFRRATELSPDNARAYSNLGGVYQAMGRPDEAEVMLGKSATLKPTASALSNLGTLQFSRGDFAEAARTFERALRVDDSSHRVWRNLASAYHWAPGERGKARAAYERAARLAERERAVNPRNAGLLVRLADCYAMLGEAGKARRLVSDALALAPRDVDVMFQAGSVYELLGERGRALDWIGKAVEHGYPAEDVKRAPDLKELRADPRFERKTGESSEKSAKGGVR
jgi:serine/threonine-protein kinase